MFDQASRRIVNFIPADETRNFQILACECEGQLINLIYNFQKVTATQMKLFNL